MTTSSNNAAEAVTEALERGDDRQGARTFFDVEVHLPVGIDKAFLSAALLYAIENKVEFAVFHEPGKIVIAYDPAGTEFMPSRWSDKRWHIGSEQLSLHSHPDDD